MLPDKPKIIIDTTIQNRVTINLVDGTGKNNELVYERIKSQSALPIIEKLLKLNSLRASDLKSINVMTGPGSFTGIRVGIVIAKTLALILGITVNQTHAVAEIKLNYEPNKFD